MAELQQCQWVSDVVLPVLAIGIMLGLWLGRRCDLAIFLAFWVGCLIGAVWEFAFDLLGESFTVHDGCHFVADNEICLPGSPLPRWYISLAHTIEDGAIFMIGVALAWLFLGRNRPGAFTRWHGGEFGIIWAWGVISNYLVDWTSVGSTFLFIPNEYNPAYLQHVIVLAEWRDDPIHRRSGRDLVRRDYPLLFRIDRAQAPLRRTLLPRHQSRGRRRYR